MVRVALEVSDLLDPQGGGAYTYTLELARSLWERDDVRLSFLVADHGYERRDWLSAKAVLPPAPAEFARILVPLLGTTEGRWKKDYRTRRMVYGLDRIVMERLARFVDGVPRLAVYRLPPHLRRASEVCHWSLGAAAWGHGPAHVVTVHDSISISTPEWHPLPDAYANRLRRAVRLADRVIVDSESTKADLTNLLALNPERIDAIPLAVSGDFRVPSAEDERRVLDRYGLWQRPYVLCLSSVEPRKNLVRLAEAFREIAARPDVSPIRLVLAGKDGWGAQSVHAALAGLHLGDRLIKLGRVPREDLPAVLHGSTAVVYPSLHEGFGLPPLEAMACGAAVIVSGTTSLPEVVGEAGILVNPESVREIRDALQRLTNNRAERERLRAAGLRRAREFTWERTADLTVAAYRRALSAHGVSHKDAGFSQSRGAVGA